MNEEQSEALEKYTDNRSDFENLHEDAIFTYGFKLGAKMMLEIMTEEIKNN